MLSAGFVDLILLIVFISFAAKGYITGFIRSVVTLVAVFIAFGVSAAMPTIASFMLGYSIAPDAPNYMVVNRLVSFFLFFGVIQSIGFLATGLLEKIGLGTADKAVGLVLGVITGVLVGCLPGVAINQSKVAYNHPPNQKYYKSSVFFKVYKPIINGIARPPKAKPRHAAAFEPNVT